MSEKLALLYPGQHHDVTQVKHLPWFRILVFNYSLMKEKLTFSIIDDEPLAQEILEEYIAKVSLWS